MSFDSSKSPEKERKIILSRDFVYTVDSSELPEGDEQYQKKLEEAGIVGDRRRRFWNMLVANVNKAGYVPPEGRKTIVLDLACGNCEEAGVLSAFFGGSKFGNESNEVKVVGVDENQKVINDAKTMYKYPDFSEKPLKYIMPDNYEFICGDATKLYEYPQIPSAADVVVIRHQQISFDQTQWTKIFRSAINTVTPEGIVIITSYSDEEHNSALQVLNGLNCDVVLNVVNAHAKPLGNKWISLDRNIAIIRKRK